MAFFKLFRKYEKNERGTTSLELAIILPVLILILFAIFEFGVAYNNYLAITHAAREGARLAAVGNYSETVVRERAYPVDPTSVDISYPNGYAHGEPVEVTVRYDYQLEIPFFGVRTLPLVSSAQMRLEV